MATHSLKDEYAIVCRKPLIYKKTGVKYHTGFKLPLRTLMSHKMPKLSSKAMQQVKPFNARAVTPIPI